MLAHLDEPEQPEATGLGLQPGGSRAARIRVAADREVLLEPREPVVDRIVGLRAKRRRERSVTLKCALADRQAQHAGRGGVALGLSLSSPSSPNPGFVPSGSTRAADRPPPPRGAGESPGPTASASAGGARARRGTAPGAPALRRARPLRGRAARSRCRARPPSWGPARRASPARSIRLDPRHAGRPPEGPSRRQGERRPHHLGPEEQANRPQDRPTVLLREGGTRRRSLRERIAVRKGACAEREDQSARFFDRGGDAPAEPRADLLIGLQLQAAPLALERPEDVGGPPESRVVPMDPERALRLLVKVLQRASDPVADTPPELLRVRPVLHRPDVTAACLAHPGRDHEGESKDHTEPRYRAPLVSVPSPHATDGADMHPPRICTGPCSHVARGFGVQWVVAGSGHAGMLPLPVLRVTRRVGLRSAWHSKPSRPPHACIRGVGTSKCGHLRLAVARCERIAGQ